MAITRSQSSRNQEHDQQQTSSSDLLAMGDIARSRPAAHTPLPERSSEPESTAASEHVHAIASTPLACTSVPVPVPQQEQQREQRESTPDTNSTSPYENRFIQVTADGYIEHKEIGFVMHPSFYDDEESNFSLCTNMRACRHDVDCYEIRKRMAVFACIRGLTYREAAYLWGVSKSTLQREVVENGNRMSLKFLITPEK